MLSAQAQTLLLNASAVQSQINALFYGGSGGAGSAGRGRSVWNNPVSAAIQAAQTSGVIVSSGIAMLPTAGNTAGNPQSPGGTLSALTLRNSTDSSLRASQDARSFLEQPLETAAAWTFLGRENITLSMGGNSPVGAFEINATPGVEVYSLAQNGDSVPFQVIHVSGTLWIIPNDTLPTANLVTLALRSPTSMSSVPTTGSVSSIKAHTFNFDSNAQCVWGPFSRSAQGLFSVTLDSVTSVSPSGASVNMQVSPVSPDGPWTDFPAIGSPLLLSASGSAGVDLLPGQAQPDPLSQGFYRYSCTQSGSLVGAEFTAGRGQAKAEAYFFDWSSTGEVAHDVRPSDWTSPQGTPRTVALGAGPTFRGDAQTQSFPTTAFKDAGTCLGMYRDSRGVEATYIALRDAVPSIGEV